MGLSLQMVNKTVHGERHLKDINIELESGSRNVILGHTLAGKTSLLRIMAGLDRPTGGKVLVDGKDVTGTSVRKRNVAMVYQQFINYPSMSVYKNIASPLRISGLNPKEIERRVHQTAELLHLEDMLDRYPSELSGGQQQRIAIARSLVKDAELLLLDEPLVNLDYKLREELREELQEIFKQREAIVVYTSTEPSEALMLGGNIIVLDAGQILQTGPTAEVYHHPATLRVAEVYSDPPINYLNGNVRQNAVQLGQDIQLPLNGHLSGLVQGNYLFGVRANRFFLDRTAEKDIALQAVVALAEINGSETFIHVNHADNRLVVQENGIYTYKIGSEITVYVNPDSFYVYDEAGKLVASPPQVS